MCEIAQRRSNCAERKLSTSGLRGSAVFSNRIANKNKRTAENFTTTFYLYIDFCFFILLLMINCNCTARSGEGGWVCTAY